MGRLCAAILAVLLLAACSSGSSSTASTASTAACKAAMTRDYQHALAHPDAPAATRPAACKGVPDATLQKLAAQIMASTGG